MNISTGGPHILLFERDQQLATLLKSELQLAGYELHTARTAVEVFDAIARHSVRLVLVNLAQAAAARREFWVALDTQRRGSGIEVLTFHCSNLAGYGPRDLEDRGQTPVADMEIDGMAGLMSLVDAVRARIPGVEATTLPRLPRSAAMSAPHSSPIPPQTSSASTGPIYNTNTYRPQQPAPAQAGAPLFSQSGNANLYSNPPQSYQGPTVRSQVSAPPQTPPLQPVHTAPIVQTINPGLPPISPATELPTSNNPTTYSEKIRAVLYPNQHQKPWNTTPSNGAQAGWTEKTGENVRLDMQNGLPTLNTPPLAVPTTQTTDMLQRLANGQVGMEGPSESGLAQLSRMVQGSRTAPKEDYHASTYATTPGVEFQVAQPEKSAPAVHQGHAVHKVHHQEYQHAPHMTRSTALSEDTEPTSAVISAIRPGAAQQYPAEPAAVEDTISAPSLRPAPIQGLPGTRPIAAPGYAETARRGDNNYTRPSYHQTYTAQGQNGSQPAPQSAAQSPLASIASAAATPAHQNTVNATFKSGEEHSGTAKTVPAHTVSQTVTAKTDDQVTHIPIPQEIKQREIAGSPTEQQTVQNSSTGSSQSATVTPSQILNSTLASEQYQSANIHQKAPEARAAQHEIILDDILQSLPPIPGKPGQQNQQAIQAQVLNGRAQRALGSVLLDGHLVPQDRLDVAQNIQRMLRGVDLNYQLGDILLMFKLLTPDQLLAASLVSYGLLNSTQISALGRIRQDLHAIGLEYDLENLLILFRILTPEQVREVRSNVQN